MDLSLRGSSANRVVRVDVDRAGAEGVTIEDCGRVSELLGESIESGDLLPGRHVLEVSSPGIDRPIRTADDIRRNTGRRVVVETREEIEGRRRFRGVLLGVDAGELRIRAIDDEFRIPLERIELARRDVAF